MLALVKSEDPKKMRLRKKENPNHFFLLVFHCFIYFRLNWCFFFKSISGVFLPNFEKVESLNWFRNLRGKPCAEKQLRGACVVAQEHIEKAKKLETMLSGNSGVFPASMLRDA